MPADNFKKLDFFYLIIINQIKRTVHKFTYDRLTEAFNFS